MQSGSFVKSFPKSVLCCTNDRKIKAKVYPASDRYKK